MSKIYYHIISIVLLFSACKQPNQAYIKLTNGKTESCLACHTNYTGFSKFHNPNDIGCSACHLGAISETDKDKAHENMIKIPGNLSNVSKTCSTSECHESELDRVHKSLMSTNSGIVSIDRWAFGEVHTTDTLFHIENISDSAADKHLKNLCFKCHLGYEKKHYAATSELSRGGGCLACHLNYTDNSTPDIKDNIHPTLNLNIANDKCFGCHSRSNRISTNYEGWYETLYTKEEVKDSTGYRVLQDGRVFDYVQDDVHHQAGLLCIDCHVSQEIMGDGHAYKHQTEALKVQCKDCHTTSQHKTAGFESFSSIEALDYSLRDYKHKTKKFIITEKNAIPLVNTYFDKNDDAFLISKINQNLHQIKGSCKQDQVHGNLACNMCHTTWAPSCIGCHTSYDNDVLLTNGKRGKWREMLGGFSYSKPVMGVNRTTNSKIITPAVPGMIMTLDKSNFKGNKKGHDQSFLRLFAPVAAHTTSKEVRSCESCHNNSQALGYGQGVLTYQVERNIGKWRFESLYENSDHDNLPQDAWNGFLIPINEKTKKYSAHEGFYPLDLIKQKNILQVGACLQCHKEDKTFKNQLIYGAYKNLVAKKSVKCVLPF